MKKLIKWLLAGLLVIAPIYLAILLLLKAAQSLAGLVQPIAKLFPEWLPGAQFLSLLLVLIICVLVGALVSTGLGRAHWDRMEKALFHKVPGYALFKGLTQQMAGRSQETTWKPALVEIEEALVPAFIIEVHDDGSSTVFVPSIPTPFAGAVYVLTPDRVHPLNVPFTQAFKTVSRWGSGCKELVAAMRESEQGQRFDDRPAA